MSKHIWVVDDDRSIRFVLSKALKRAGFEVSTFERGNDVLEALESHRPSALVSDIRMPGISGTELLATMKERWPDIPVIIMTAFSDLDSAVSAFQGGAFEYLPKPFDIGEAVELISRAAAEGEKATLSVTDGSVSSTSGLIGKAPAMQDVFRAIGRLSQSNATVLLTGESGSGKEVVARAIKDHSQRAKAAYVAINMASIPRELLESELYGHEKGAFTGATTLHRGRFEQAKGGTIFLDEIGDMPMDLQTSLLRVLSDGYFYRVGGGHEPIKADVRVIAATNQNMEERVKEGLFREDLYHRLNVIRLRLPPLRERKEDIPRMVEYFLRTGAKELGVEPKRLTKEALDSLMAFDFPGNVRQLENFCRWLLVMAPSSEIRPQDLPPEVQSATPSVVAFSPAASSEGDSTWRDALRREVTERLAASEEHIWDTVMEEVEQTVIEAALDATDGRRVEAATRLGIGRNTLTRKLKQD